MTHRFFVCGDIHGCYDKLMDALSIHNFDHHRDTLWALGDLVDRGPESMRVLRLLNEPWFHSVRGNHEQMVISMGGRRMHLMNGGWWFNLLDQTEKDEAVALCESMPIRATIITPTNRRIGLVHADLLGNDWNVDPPEEHALWSRNRVESAHLHPIQNIDHVYFGHTPLSEVLTRENMSWIDTGACFNAGKLTMIELE
jgi:serine/threonine protein phosphatase 1